MHCPFGGFCLEHSVSHLASGPLPSLQLKCHFPCRLSMTTGKPQPRPGALLQASLPPPSSHPSSFSFYPSVPLLDCWSLRVKTLPGLQLNPCSPSMVPRAGRR